MNVRSHSWQGVTATVYHLNKGEKIPRHRHNVAHTTAVLAGRTEAEIFDRMMTEMDPSDPGLILPEGIDHEIRALENGTIVMNMIAVTYTTVDYPDGPPAQAGGVELHDGTVVAHEAD
jgi:quercetin dioxygenase-like cupin family protein